MDDLTKTEMIEIIEDIVSTYWEASNGHRTSHEKADVECFIAEIASLVR